MVITGIHKRRGKRYLLELDGEPAVTVDVRTFEESPYKVGSCLEEEELQELLEESSGRRAKEKALYLLSRRDYSRGELEKKLAQDAGKKAAAQTAERMEEWGLVNDEAYAERLAAELRLRRHYPFRRTVQEMTARGLDRELADRAAREVDTEDWKQALELLQKKYYNKLDNQENRRKTMAALARFGFGGEDIRRAIREYVGNDENTVVEDEEKDEWLLR